MTKVEFEKEKAKTWHTCSCGNMFKHTYGDNVIICPKCEKHVYIAHFGTFCSHWR